MVFGKREGDKERGRGELTRIEWKKVGLPATRKDKDPKTNPIKMVDLIGGKRVGGQIRTRQKRRVKFRVLKVLSKELTKLGVCL